MEISKKVIRVMQGEHISPAELEQMVRQAAIASAKGGFNRRFGHWLFRMSPDGNQLHDMQWDQMVHVGRGHSTMIEDHDPCDGEGCHGCGWIGKISRSFTDTTQLSLNRAIS